MLGSCNISRKNPVIFILKKYCNADILSCFAYFCTKWKKHFIYIHTYFIRFKFEPDRTLNLVLFFVACLSLCSALSLKEKISRWS